MFHPDGLPKIYRIRIHAIYCHHLHLFTQHDITRTEQFLSLSLCFSSELLKFPHVFCLQSLLPIVLEYISLWLILGTYETFIPNICDAICFLFINPFVSNGRAMAFFLLTSSFTILWLRRVPTNTTTRFFNKLAAVLIFDESVNSFFLVLCYD